MKFYASFVTLIICAISASAGNLKAAELSFQPRLETGVMAYSFSSDEAPTTKLSRIEPLYTGNNFAQASFEYKDNLSFIDTGGTVFFRRWFLDISGKYAFDGDDTETVAWSGFAKVYTERPDAAYMGGEAQYEVTFDRKEIAVSLGFGIGRECHLFGGYKWAQTDFFAVYDGPSGTVFNFDGYEQIKNTGRVWGYTDHNFKYEGPFIGVVQAWNFDQRRYVKGTLTANLALAYLYGKVESENRNGYLQIQTVGGKEVLSPVIKVGGGGLTNRFETKGESVGITLGMAWLGLTPLEDLSYYIGINGYRYEFDAEEHDQSDIYETSVVYKFGVAYSF